MAVVTGAAIRGVHGGYTVTRKCPNNYGLETSRLIDKPDHVSSWNIFDNMQFDNTTTCWVARKV